MISAMCNVYLYVCIHTCMYIYYDNVYAYSIYMYIPMGTRSEVIMIVVTFGSFVMIQIQVVVSLSKFH